MDERVHRLVSSQVRTDRRLQLATQTLGESIREKFKRKKGDQVGRELTDDEIQNPNSFFRVSLDPANQDMWIGVRVGLLPNGVVVEDAKWVHKEREVVLDGIHRAESMTAGDAYHLYGPANEIGARKMEIVRFDDERYTSNGL